MVEVLVNGQPLGSVVFEQDAPARERFLVPADLLDVGWNELTFRSIYAISPTAATEGANPDARPLTFGVSRLAIHPVLTE